MTSTPNLPDGISTAELQAMLSDAPKEAAVNEKEDFSQERIEEISDRLLQQALDECNTPVMHKAMCVEIISNFIEWHTRVGLSRFEDGDSECATGWMRDAGKLQSMLNILMNISMGPDDFLMNDN